MKAGHPALIGCQRAALCSKLLLLPGLSRSTSRQDHAETLSNMQTVLKRAAQGLMVPVPPLQRLKCASEVPTHRQSALPCGRFVGQMHLRPERLSSIPDLRAMAHH